MFIASIVFAVSLVGIIVLFALKAWELRSDKLIAPVIREKTDQQAIEIKAMLMQSRGELSKLPPALLHLSRAMLHEMALALARFARVLERQAHRTADLVSHKRNFERRDTNSEFLKKISDTSTSASSDEQNL